jgi:hypothetical protein
MGPLYRESLRAQTLRTRIVLIEPSAMRRRELRRLLTLAGYDVRGFARASNAAAALRDCDVIVAALDPQDVSARLLVQPLVAVRGQNGAVEFRPRRCAIVATETAAAELEGGFDHVFVAPVDCAALLRWLALHALARISPTNRDWVNVTQSLTSGRPRAAAVPSAKTARA